MGGRQKIYKKLDTSMNYSEIWPSLVPPFWIMWYFKLTTVAIF